MDEPLIAPLQRIPSMHIGIRRAIGHHAEIN
jgi:hypothetical protein